jgi:hypothetical protein
MLMPMAAAAGPVDPVAAVDPAEVVAPAAAVGTEVQWAAAQPHPGVSPAVGAGTVVQVTRPPQPALTEPLCLIALAWRPQEIR